MDEGARMEGELELLVRQLLDGDTQGALAQTRKLMRAGCDPERIVAGGIQPAMQSLDTKCTAEGFNLLEIMLTGRAVMAIVAELFPEGTTQATRGTVVIGTPQGDVHDLGKNVTRMVLVAKGYRVVDCGKDCPIETMIEAAQREGAFALLASGLITPVIPQVRRLRGLLQERGLHGVTLVAGGAALQQSAADALNVDYVARDAFDGARFLDSICGGPS